MGTQCDVSKFPASSSQSELPKHVRVHLVLFMLLWEKPPGNCSVREKGLLHHLRAGSIMIRESQRQGLEAAGHTIAGVRKKETHAGALLGFSSVIWFKTPDVEMVFLNA